MKTKKVLKEKLKAHIKNNARNWKIEYTKNNKDNELTVNIKDAGSTLWREDINFLNILRKEYSFYVDYNYIKSCLKIEFWNLK